MFILWVQKNNCNFKIIIEDNKILNNPFNKNMWPTEWEWEWGGGGGGGTFAKFLCPTRNWNVRRKMCIVGHHVRRPSKNYFQAWHLGIAFNRTARKKRRQDKAFKVKMGKWRITFVCPLSSPGLLRYFMFRYHSELHQRYRFNARKCRDVYATWRRARLLVGCGSSMLIYVLIWAKFWKLLSIVN